MALTFLHQPNNKPTHVQRAGVWVSDDAGLTYVRLSTSAELTVTPQEVRDSIITNSGASVEATVLSSYDVELRFIERGEDVRRIWTPDTDQALRGVELTLWIQGAELLDTGGDETYEQYCFPYAKLRHDHGPITLGAASAMYTASFHCRANLGCADVVIPPPCDDPCYLGAADGVATIEPGEIYDTLDSAA